jgi:hypothetical protein
MAKYFQRLGSLKLNFLIQINIASIVADVSEPTLLSVVWVRGPAIEETKRVDLDPRIGSVQVN